VPSVSATNALGGRAATEHLLALGHRRIGAITGVPEWLASVERLNGYRAALASAGVVPDSALVVESDWAVEGGEAAAGHLLDLPDPPTAVFAFNDNMAIGALRAARARGLRVPADFSVVGFDDSEQATTATPGLTTVHQPVAAMGRIAVTLLLRLLEHRAAKDCPSSCRPASSCATRPQRPDPRAIGKGACRRVTVRVGRLVRQV
jgi:Transcriptional regulators